MAIESKTTVDTINTASTHVQDQRIRTAALKVGFFIWHYFEMMLAMGVGAILFDQLVSVVPASTRSALNLYSGTFPYISGIALAMMIVMVAWMIVRGHGWRHSAEMAAAMLIPVAWMAVISTRKGSPYWFDATYCTAMCVGMLAAMLYRWDHFTRWSFRSSLHVH